MLINFGRQRGTAQLKNFVKDQDITVVELSTRANIDRIQASRLINGSHCGMLVAALKIAKLLDKSVEEVFGYLLK